MQQLLAHAADQLGADLRVAQLVFRLRLEHRVLQPDRHRADHALAHVVAVELAVAILVHRLEQALAERAQVRAAVAGELAVDEGIKRLAVARIAVGETKLQRLAGVMQRRVNWLAAVAGEVFHHQIHQAVARLERLRLRAREIQNQFQPGVEIAVMPQPALDVFQLVFAVLEDFRVRLEFDERAVRLLRFAGGLFF